MRRRNFLVALGATVVAGCDAVGDSAWFGKIVDRAQDWHRGLHRTLGGGRISMAPEYGREAISPFFRGNGTQSVDTAAYRAAMEDGFANWTISVSGLVEHPLELAEQLAVQRVQRLGPVEGDQRHGALLLDFDRFVGHSFLQKEQADKAPHTPVGPVRRQVLKAASRPRLLSQQVPADDHAHDLVRAFQD